MKYKYRDIGIVDKPNTDYKEKRDCYKQLQDFIYTSKKEGRILALYGIRRTGKTVLLNQLADELEKKNIPYKYYIVRNKTTFDKLDDLLYDDKEKGIKYVFIDEITLISDFISWSATLADFYANSGMKIIIAGTDSLSISLASLNRLYDRVTMLNISYVSYGEFNRLLGLSLDDYIKYGGTLTNSPYKDNNAKQNYINSAIIDNILHSLENNEGVQSYPPQLTELYDEGEIKSCINKIINTFNQTVTLKAILKDYKNGPLNNTLSSYNQSNINYRRYIDVEKVTEYLKKELDIIDKNEMKVKLTQEHVDLLKVYLRSLNVYISIPVYKSLKKMGGLTNEIEFISQPGMVYSHAEFLIKALNSDEHWKNTGLPDEDRQKFVVRTTNHVCGSILENAVLQNTFLNLESNKDYYVSKVSAQYYPQGKNIRKDNEVDMIIVNEKIDEVYLFEVKNSTHFIENHERHLVDEDFMNYIEENFGHVKGKYVIYNGENKVNEKTGVKHINAEYYFKEIYKLVYNKDSIKKNISNDLNNEELEK